jgi:hypothetical protein
VGQSRRSVEDRKFVPLFGLRVGGDLAYGVALFALAALVGFVELHLLRVLSGSNAGRLTNHIEVGSCLHSAELLGLQLLCDRAQPRHEVIKVDVLTWLAHVVRLLLDDL